MFKIDDKVRITEAEPCKEYRGKIGRVTVTDRIKKGLSGCWDYQVTFDGGILDYVFSSNEMEIAFVKNQQLEFSFMEQ